MRDHDAIIARLERLENELDGTRTRARTWRNAAIAATALLLLAPLTVDAGRAKKELVLRSDDGNAEAVFNAEGFVYRNGGNERLRFDIGDTWDGFTMYGEEGEPAITLGTDEMSTSLRIYSDKKKLRVELSDTLLDSGSGLRLYDEDGKPRATFYAGQRDGESGVRLTDADRQPRVDIFAKPGGVSVVRASDSAATSVAEISVSRESDATYRQMGFVPVMGEHDSLVPMVYMLDHTGTNKLIMPVTPH